MSRLFPQIPLALGRSLFERHLADSSMNPPDTAHDKQEYSPLGGSRTTQGDIEGLSKEVRRVHSSIELEQLGQVEAHARFDVEVARVLYRHMDITPHEAAQAGVWRFLCAVTFPDLVVWRFARDGAVSEERYTGIVRNTFGRLWWRAFILDLPTSSDREFLLRELNEDELVQIMERPSIAGNPVVAKALASAFLQIVDKDKDGERRLAKIKSGRQTLMRECARRLLRRATVTGIHALSDDEVSALVAEELSETLEALFAAG